MPRATSIYSLRNIGAKSTTLKVTPGEDLDQISDVREQIVDFAHAVAIDYCNDPFLSPAIMWFDYLDWIV